jgi:hypothetical protein
MKIDSIQVETIANYIISSSAVHIGESNEICNHDFSNGIISDIERLYTTAGLHAGGKIMSRWKRSREDRAELRISCLPRK